MIDWLVWLVWYGLLVGWLVGWLVWYGLLIGWLVWYGWLTYWLVDYLDIQTLWAFGEMRLYRVDTMYCEYIRVSSVHHVTVNCKAINLYLLNRFSSYEGFHIMASYCLPRMPCYRKLSMYRVFLFSFLRARQISRVESSHAPSHTATAAVLRDTTKYALLIAKNNLGVSAC